MAKNFIFLLFSFSLFLQTQAQQKGKDTLIQLREIRIVGYHQSQSLLRATQSVSIIDSTFLKLQSPVSLVATFNQTPGVRMEERSPGSYRLSIRGSLLRSPFGIRNVKIYFQDFPLTDAGGNSYLNLLDAQALEGAEIYKGPNASQFGANTGGVILLNPLPDTSRKADLSIHGGSYGLWQQHLSLNRSFQKHHFQLKQGYQQSDGYRENSKLKRFYLQYAHQHHYHPKAFVQLLNFYSHLQYQTPGGLTAAQAESNPRMSRPATATLPGAAEQRAGIFNQSLFTGLSHRLSLGQRWKHILALNSLLTDFKNPFITNYETREERNFALRTLIAYDYLRDQQRLQLQAGLESGFADSRIRNYDNLGGKKGKSQADDRLGAQQHFAFLKANLDLASRLYVEVASSIHFFNYHYTRYFPGPNGEGEHSFHPIWMPRIGLSYLISARFSLNASISRGYAPPTIAELRSSDNRINEGLTAEKGWNSELGGRWASRDLKHYASLQLFNYRLKGAIVRRLNQDDIEYFVNAGGTHQQGIEWESHWTLWTSPQRMSNRLIVKQSYSYHHFKFSDFTSGQNTVSGNWLTGVPRLTTTHSLNFHYGNHQSLFLQHSYSSRIPLNDLNTAYAAAYHLVDLKTTLPSFKISGKNVEIYVGIQNLLNRKYSLGNDLNAVSGRYYNPAAGINFYSGCRVHL